MNKRKISVMIIASGDLWAGAEAVVYNLASGLKKNDNVRLSVIIFNDGMLFQKLNKENINIKLFDESINSFIKLLFMVLKYAKNFKPDIIHSHRYKENLLSFGVKCITNKIKLITTVHGILEKNLGLKTKIISAINRIMIQKFFNYIIPVSDEIKLYLEKNRFNPNKIVRIYNGIDCGRKINKKRDELIVIGSAGRLVGVKDFYLLLDISKRLRDKKLNLKFVIAGEGPLRNEIEKRIQKNNLQDSFLLLGYLKNMEKFYQEIDIYINTSYHEGIPITILEAMSHSIPVIAASVGGIPEIIENKINGILVEERTVGSYVNSIERLISNEILYNKIKENARKIFIEKFSLENMVNSYEKLYISIDK